MYVLQLLWLLICSVGWTPEDGSKEKLAQVPVQLWSFSSTPAILYNFICTSPSPPSFYINFLVIHVVSSSSLSIQYIDTYHLHYPFSILLTFWRQRQKCSRTIFHLQLRYDTELCVLYWWLCWTNMDASLLSCTVMQLGHTSKIHLLTLFSGCTTEYPVVEVVSSCMGKSDLLCSCVLVSRPTCSITHSTQKVSTPA